jgi:hypothetical protein
MVSPLQGFKVNVTNLHPVVSQDDIIVRFSLKTVYFIYN